MSREPPQGRHRNWLAAAAAAALQAMNAQPIGAWRLLSAALFCKQCCQHVSLLLQSVQCWAGPDRQPGGPPDSRRSEQRYQEGADVHELAFRALSRRTSCHPQARKAWSSAALETRFGSLHCILTDWHINFNSLFSFPPAPHASPPSLGPLGPLRSALWALGLSADRQGASRYPRQPAKL